MEDPISRDQLFKSLKEKLTKAGLEHLIRRVEEWKVSFRLDEADEKKIRSLQKQLGKARLHDLIAAIREYRTEPSTKSDAQQPSEEPPKPIQKLSVSVEEISSQREDLPYGLSVILHTTVPINPVHMVVICDGPIGDARVGFSPPPGAAFFTSNMFGKATRIAGTTFEFSFANPPFTPRGPLEVKLFSAHKLRVLDVRSLD